MDTIMYFVVNADLKMKPGKTAAQVAHTAVKLYQRHHKDAFAKIVLTAPEATLRELHAKYEETVLMVDAGLTQVAPGSVTVLGFPASADKHTYPELKELKLHR